MENYNQPSHREENRQSGTVPSWYNLNRPYNEHNRQQFPDMGNHLAFGEDDHDQQPGQSDRNKEERSAQRPAQYNAPDEDDLDDDDPDNDAPDLDRAAGEEDEEDELKSYIYRQNYSSRRNGAYNETQLTF